MYFAPGFEFLAALTAELGLLQVEKLGRFLSSSKRSPRSNITFVGTQLPLYANIFKSKATNFFKTWDRQIEISGHIFSKKS